MLLQAIALNTCELKALTTTIANTIGELKPALKITEFLWTFFPSNSPVARHCALIWQSKEPFVTGKLHFNNDQKSKKFWHFYLAVNCCPLYPFHKNWKPHQKCHCGPFKIMFMKHKIKFGDINCITISDSLEKIIYNIELSLNTTINTLKQTKTIVYLLLAPAILQMNGIMFILAKHLQTTTADFCYKKLAGKQKLLDFPKSVLKKQLIILETLLFINSVRGDSCYCQKTRKLWQKIKPFRT